MELLPNRTARFRRQRPSTKPIQRVRGFTLIEILVAMMVAAFGILGIIGMNATSIKLQSDSASRSRAAIQAQDIFDRMRANTNSAILGQYNRTLNAPIPPLSNPMTMANQDLRNWLTNLARDLPNGAGAVNVLPSGDASVTIQWVERENRGAAAGNVSFTFTSSL